MISTELDKMRRAHDVANSIFEMVKHFCNTNTEKISLYYEYLFSNGVRYPFDECGRM